VILVESFIRNQKDVKAEKRPVHTEVYGQLLSPEKENGRLSAHRITVKPGGEILPHIHEVLELI
jgi:predicted metal-dependent enzyme (double-stranded beta helix superfamily)